VSFSGEPDEETASVAVLIPRDAFPTLAKLPDRVPPRSAAKRSSESPVAGLAAARHEDAIEFAMVSSSAMAAPPPATALAPMAGAPSGPIQLASLDASSITTSALPLPAIQISLP
jgi:hypothetical protein